MIARPRTLYAPRPGPSAGRGFVRASIAVVALVAYAIFAVAPGALAEPESAPGDEPALDVNALGWLSGCWVQDAPVGPGGIWQETWGTPIEGVMTGSLVWVRQGQPALYELITIAKTEDGAIMRIRHFSSDFTPWASEADGPVELKLTEQSDRSMVFTSDDPDAFPATITYTRTARDGQPDLLTVDLAGMENGKPNAFGFRFERRRTD